MTAAAKKASSGTVETDIVIIWYVQKRIKGLYFGKGMVQEKGRIAKSRRSFVASMNKYITQFLRS